MCDTVEISDNICNSTVRRSHALAVRFRLKNQYRARIKMPRQQAADEKRPTTGNDP